MEEGGQGRASRKEGDDRPGRGYGLRLMLGAGDEMGPAVLSRGGEPLESPVPRRE